MQILIVDDSKAMRMIVSRCLRKADLGPLEILEAANGREGLEAAKEHLPDIVLTDWNMPEMSGLELIQALQESSLNLKVGVVTSDAGGQTREQAMDAGALFVVRKPFTPEVFKTHIDAAMSNREASAADDGGAAPARDELPGVDAIAGTINGLLPREARIWAANAPEIQRDMTVGVAMYGHDGEEHGFAACDFATALGLAAAMTLVPQTVVETGVTTKQVPEELAGNVKEVFNVLGSLFGRSTLLNVALPPANSNFILRNRMKGAKKRVDVNVEIPGYGAGWLLMAAR